jgi:23S rRNA pseudouridine2457 synthase
MVQPQSHRYFAINKPYHMVSQFKGTTKVALLGSLDFDFPEGTHAIGRLDSHSEGLLLLTTNKRVTRLLFQGETPHKRIYIVRVSGHVTAEELEMLRTAVTIRIEDGKDYTTPPCEVDIIATPDNLQPYQLEKRVQVPHTWLRMTLYEGKYHQVRKMVAAINHNCRRLIRVAIEDMELGTLAPGAVHEMDEDVFFRKLNIDYKGSNSLTAKIPHAELLS